MLRTTWATWTRGRRGAVTAAVSAAVGCLGVAVAAGGDGPSGGDYVAVGPVGISPPVRLTPTGGVTLTPLDGGGGTGAAPSGSPSGAGPSEVAPGGSAGPAAAANGPGHLREAHPGPSASAPSAPSAPSSATSPSHPSAPGPTHTPAPTPAALTWGAPAREGTDQRWCEEVTVAFRNTGGTSVRSGTVTFGTHVIGSLGVDWATVTSTQSLPVPIGAGAGTRKSWTVCVDAWRVPLGMHIETRDVTVQWK
ncbi:hypothetical protein [Streptomyces sp. NPDC086787]|uniref:hypothetical protein n=1 Tax=Streptomyces sp. NPDC086787 TaxID=3365759 RepID=UPI0037F8B105